MKNIKIRVKNPEHSKKIQEKLFEMGYQWPFGEDNQVFSYVTRQFLFANSEGFITYGNTLIEFLKVRHPEVELVEKITYEFKEVEKREVISINNKIYFLDEITEAIKNIEEIPLKAQ